MLLAQLKALLQQGDGAAEGAPGCARLEAAIDLVSAWRSTGKVVGYFDF